MPIVRGSSAYGGGGGGGGYTTYAFSQGELSTGANISVFVGGGGTGGSRSGYNFVGGNGAAGQVTITWTDPVVPTCSVWADTNPIAYGGTTVVHWTSANATTPFNINYIGPVTANQTSQASVSFTATTNLNGSASGPGGSVTCPYTLSVNPPASCTFNSQSMDHGASVTAYQSSTVPAGSSCSSVSQVRTCSNGTLSGSYTFASCATVPSCTLSLSPTSVLGGQSSTLTWASQNATSCTGNNFPTGSGSLTSGNISVAPSQSTTYTASCSGAGGTAQCTGSGSGGIGADLTIACTQSWACTGAGNQTIRQTNTNCSTTDLATCSSPQFCSPGASVCLDSTPSFTPSGSLTGHLQIIPRLINKNGSVKLYWNIDNVLSCSVVGNNHTFTGTASSPGGTQTASIQAQTPYTLTCLKLPDGSSSFTETQYVNIIPGFKER